MKQIVSNYSYSPATNVVTLTGVNIDADQLLLIVAPQVGRTLYNFASVTGVVSAGADTRVTLNASTAGLTTTSPLVIFYDDQASTQTVAGTVTANGFDFNNASYHPLPLAPFDEAPGGGKAVVAKLIDDNGSGLNLSAGVPISGTVTANLPLGNSFVYLVNGDNDTTVGSSNPIPVAGSVSVGNISADGGQTFEGFLSVKIDPDYYQVGLDRITPEVTVTNLVNTGFFTTRFGTPATANTVFATSAVTNGQRKYLLIQNVTTGSNVITVGIGFTPTTTRGIQLTAGAGITFESSYIPIGAVYVLSSVTASNFTILEG